MLEDNYRHRGMRNTLIKTIQDKGIKSPSVLQAINRVPRHYFFENAFLEHAYEDKAFPIGEGQTISQPYTVAFQTELLELNPGEKVLEIGTGSGYQACILAELGAQVYSIEYNKVLYGKTKRFLREVLNYPQIRCFQGDGSKGLPRFCPYHKIIVTAGSPSVPKSLLQQLAVGGHIVIPVGDNESQRMIRITKKTENQLIRKSYNYFSFVPLLGEEGWKAN